jgi:hypothetical protein
VPPNEASEHGAYAIRQLEDAVRISLTDESPAPYPLDVASDLAGFAASFTEPLVLLTRRDPIGALAYQGDCTVSGTPKLVGQLRVPSRKSKRDFLDSVRHFDAHAVHIKFVVGELVTFQVHA